jgi:hypothetical protein
LITERRSSQCVSVPGAAAVSPLFELSISHLLMIDLVVPDLLVSGSAKDLAYCFANPRMPQIAVKARKPHQGMRDAGKLFSRLQSYEFE